MRRHPLPLVLALVLLAGAAPLAPARPDEAKRPGALGITAGPVSSSLAERWKVRPLTRPQVYLIFPGSAAEKGGLKADDVFLQVDGKDVRTLPELLKALAGDEGRKLKLLVLRGGEKVEVPLALGHRASPTEAAKAFRALADKGNPEAQRQLGLALALGRGVDKDLAEAEKWLRKSADKGHAGGQYDLGRICEATKKLAEAAKWYRKSAGQGFAPAETNLGNLYLNGRGVEQDAEVAMKWYRKAADRGDSGGQNSVGFLYASGKGVAQDYAEAMKWFRKSADQNNFVAQCNVGALLEKGLGVPKDEKAAAEWYGKSAEQGYADAQYRLGVLYEEGRGVRADRKQAQALYKKAAAAGHPLAKKKLSAPDGVEF
jgi:TPR repeat protein